MERRKTISKKKTKPLRRIAATRTKAPIKKKVLKKIPVKKIVRKPLRKTSRPAARKKPNKDLRLARSTGNPVIVPRSEISWESKQTFNPAAFFADGKVHILYRALGDGGISVIGYAMSNDGFHIHERGEEPAYVFRREAPVKTTGSRPPVLYRSGGGIGGCEDPRTVKINDRIYLLFTVFNGWDSVQAALTSIGLDELLTKKWHWQIPVMISPPGEIHKNWALFPEKINNKYAIIHSISPKILIDYFDSLDRLDGSTFIKSISHEEREKELREKGIRGLGPPPMITANGWLLLYHAMDHRDPDRYKLWALILDANEPTKVIARSAEPILEPDEWYENEGHKSGVIYSCGAVIKDGKLFVYYGGADTVVCVATANVKRFLVALLQGKPARLTKIRKPKK